MAVEAIDVAGPLPITRDGVSSARDLIGLADLAALSRRSNLRGAGQLAVHLGCTSATGLLVWLALPYWPLLIPAMLLHGTTLVTMFAPMHECAHRTAFASHAANLAVGWIAGRAVLL